MIDVKKTCCPPQSILSKIDSLPSISFFWILFSLTVVISGAFFGCASKQMTLDEAIQTTISMRGKSFIPPPRSIDDILNVIAKKSTKDALAWKDWEKRLKIELPANATKNELIPFYLSRGQAAFYLGLYGQSRDDYQNVYELVGPENASDRLIVLLASSELNIQNYERAAALFTILKEKNRLGFLPYDQLANIFALTGQFERAERVKNEAFAKDVGPTQYGPVDIFYIVRNDFYKARLEYTLLNMKAKYVEAEPIIRRAVDAASVMPHGRVSLQGERIRLIRNLIEQNRLVEAELEARKTLEESIKFLGEENVHLLAANTIFAEVLLAQGRLTDAERVNQAAVQGYEQLDLASAYGWWSPLIETLCKILVAKADYSGAIKEYELFRAMKESNRYTYDAFYSNNKDVMLALIMTGQSVEAMDLIENAYQRSEKLLGKNHSQSAELLALRGMANNSLNNLESAYRDFSEAIPILAKSKAYAENRLSNHRFMVILESYLSLLSKIRDSLVEKRLSVSAIAKAFEASTLLSDSLIQGAVLASTARMTIKDPRLKGLTRTEQDVRQQIIAYKNLLQSFLSRPIGETDRQSIEDVKSMLEKMSTAVGIIVNEIQEKFPDYADLVNPRQPSLADVQSRLKPEEVIISICSTENITYVFVVSPSGLPEMVSVPITKKNLENLVSELKKSLSPGSDKLGQLPAYDFEKAYELYSLLLKPVEAAWKDSKHMILAISGPLGQLPFAIIPTEPFQLQKEKEVLFSNYGDAPCLIKKIAITTVPSVSSFVALRARPGSVKAKEAFAGFGDPFFNKMQLAQATDEKKIHSAKNTANETKLDIRGIRLTKDGNLDNRQLISCTIESLERLPDTADELLSIAEALGANPGRDVYLGQRASEKQVKSMDLSDRRVVAFASHALVPYDLDGLDQPAIALSAPSVTGDEDDGLLTMAEILDLKLNADWVVLSACNTGAAEGTGAEAVSGLGRAFFYAGTRALLVSMWPVETTSAKKLTTSIFRHQKENPGLSKARAHQMAMLELIEGPGMLDENGRIIASYAHPFFWAPFIIVGDNGMTNLN